MKNSAHQKRDDHSSQKKALWKQAEKILAGKIPGSKKNISVQEMERLLHELNVHQIELEMQNEELKRARLETEASLNKYSDLYEFAPVAYFTFDKNGIIDNINMTGAALLGAEKKILVKKRFQAFIEKKSHETFFNFLYKIFNLANSQVCELLLVNKQGESFYADVIGCPIKESNGEIINCRVAIADISQRKKAEGIIRSSLEEKERLDIVLQTQEEERKRISEALHNGLGQLLYAVRLKLEKIGKEYSHDLLDESKKLLTEAIRDTKKIVFEPIPAPLENYGLKKAIEDLSRNYASESLIIHCKVDGYEKKLPSAIEVAIFRIIQELLNNIVKHSKATEAKIFILIKDRVLLTVDDNGIGFIPKQLTIGFGLKNINYRIQLLNADINITSIPKKGTCITISIPLKE